jgi:hypothetical protein
MNQVDIVATRRFSACSIDNIKAKLAASMTDACMSLGNAAVSPSSTGAEASSSTLIESPSSTESTVPSETPSQPLVRFTPTQALWSSLNDKGLNHFNQSELDATWPKWDGKEVDAAQAVLNKRDGTSINAAACVGGLVKGMYDAFPDPFADPFNPTKEEVDNYNAQIIKQVFLSL